MATDATLDLREQVIERLNVLGIEAGTKKQKQIRAMSDIEAKAALTHLKKESK